MKKHSVLLAFALTAIVSLPVAAGNNTPGIDQREANLQRRLDEGVQSGALTQGEAADLQERVNHLNAAEAKAKANGKVSDAERARLQQEAENISQAIYAKKHNQRGTGSGFLDKKADREQQRIDQGVKSGKLTNGEAANIQERQNKLKADEAAAKADGRLTPQERAKLRKEEIDNGAAIHRLKHNGRDQ